MKLTITPFRPVDVELLLAQGVTELQAREAESPAAVIVRSGAIGPSVTVRSPAGIVLCGGLVLGPFQGQAKLWSLLSLLAGPHLLEVTRGVRRFLSDWPLRRIEAECIDTLDARGARWLSLLGFTYEGMMDGYGPNGERYLRFSKVNHRWPTSR